MIAIKILVNKGELNFNCQTRNSDIAENSVALRILEKIKQGLLDKKFPNEFNEIEWDKKPEADDDKEMGC